MGIEAVEVYSDNLSSWGVQVMDYSLDGADMDFQDIMIEISEKRAKVIEAEIEPMSLRMDTRNKELGYLGDALAIISDIQSQYTQSDDIGEKTSSGYLTDSSKKGLAIVGCPDDSQQDEFVTAGDKQKLKLNTKARSEYLQQTLKTRIDSLNNASSKDMTRLQSLVDKRDESYSTATSLMQAIGDTRANTIKNM